MRKYTSYGEQRGVPASHLKVVTAIFATPWVLGLILGVIALLTSCTEEVIRVIKEPYRGGEFVMTSTEQECEGTDTLKIDMVLKEVNHSGQIKKDSLLELTTACHALIRVRGYVLVPRDTVIKEVPVIVHDTVYQTRVEQRVIYSTEYLFPGQSATYIPQPLQSTVDQYFADLLARNILYPGGDIVVQYVPASKLPGEGWSSASFEMAGWQWVIYLDETLIAEHSKAALYRELSRMQLGKRYSNDVNRIMSPLFRTSPEPTSQEINQLFL